MEMLDVLNEITNQDAHASAENTILDFIYSFGNPADAILYYNLFCPKLISIHEIVTFAFWQDDKEALARLNKQIALYRNNQISQEDFQYFMSGYNYIELSHLFNQPNADIAYSHEYFLANCLVESWTAWFLHRFPKERFEFSITPSSIEQEEDIEISFVQDLS